VRHLTLIGFDNLCSKSNICFNEFLGFKVLCVWKVMVVTSIVDDKRILFNATPSPKLGPRWPSFKNAEVWGLKGSLPALSTKRGRGAC